MQMQAILDRITLRRQALDMSEAAVSMRGGSKDLIRNWRRALDRGQEISARYESLAQIAKALRVSEDWLIHGSGPTDTAPSAAQGLAETATPFTLRPTPTDAADPNATLRALYGNAVATPALYRVNTDLPAFAMNSGDVAVVDLARLPSPGEVALATILDEATASAVTMICRYVPPLLLAGGLAFRPDVFRVDDPGVTVRHPVIGCIRGLTA